MGQRSSFSGPFFPWRGACSYRLPWLSHSFLGEWVNDLLFLALFSLGEALVLTDCHGCHTAFLLWTFVMAKRKFERFWQTGTRLTSRSMCLNV